MSHTQRTDRFHVATVLTSAALPLVLIALAVTALRAEVTGSLLGVVRDPTSAVVPGVHITVTNLETKLTRDLYSDPAGQYRFLALPVGRYRIEASANGFQTVFISDVVLDVNQQRQVDVSLLVGSVTQSVVVNAPAVAVDTVSTQLGQVINERSIENMPLNGRSYVDLLALQPGVVPSNTNTGAVTTVSGELSAGNLSVNGNRETANEFLVNGGEVNEGMYLGTAVIPNLDSLAEFRVVTNSFDAEYGKFSGSTVNAITKSGTSGFHGSAFDYVRNEDMDSRNFFAPLRAALKRNQFGFAAGGPAIRNRVFWFSDYQGTREIQGASGGLVQLPTAAERTGDFSGQNAFVDASGNPTMVNGTYFASVLSQRLGYTVTSGEPYSPSGCASTSQCVFPGGVIPTSAFDPVANKTLSYIPVPNVGSEYFSTVGLGNTNLRDDKFGERVDVIDNRTGNWSAYYFFDDSSVVDPFGAANVPGFGTSTPTRAQEVVLTNTKVLGPSAVNEARLSYTGNATVSGQPTGGFAQISTLGFVTGANTLGLNPSGPASLEGVPYLGFNNTGFNIGVSTYVGDQYNNTLHASENFSKVWGRHSTKFGGDVRYYQVNLRNYNVPNGQFAFDGSETGNDFADYLVGASASFTQSSIQALDSRAKYFGAYGQDSFRIRPSLTLNYGLRWDVSTPWHDTQNRIQTIVPGEQSVIFPTAPKGWVFPGDPGVARTLAPIHYKNFGPRLGIAYSPAVRSDILRKILGAPGSTSIRAAWGMFYSSVEDLVLGWEIGDAPFGEYWNSTAPVLLEQPYMTRADGSSQGQRFPFVMPVVGGSANQNVDFTPFLPIAGSPGYSTTNQVPYTQHYNFTIQRALGKSTVASIGYVGTQGDHLLAELQANPGNAALCLSLRGTGVMAGTPQCGRYGEGSVYTKPDGTIVNGTRYPLGPDFGSNQCSDTLANSD
jgi:hypothetical protein